MISQRNKQTIDTSTAIDFVRGRADSVAYDEGQFSITTRDPKQTVSADMFVNALGFDPWKVLQIVDHSAVELLLDDCPHGAKLRERTESDILPDLSLPSCSGLPAGLLVPGLSSLAQGPGMATLGALGLMARNVLGA